MRWLIFVILLAFWMLGFATGNTLGGFVHLLVLLALVVLAFHLFSGRHSIV